MTLTFDLQLNVTLTMLHNILLGVNSYCWKYEVFDLEMTLTLVFDLKMTLTLVITSPHGVIA